MSLRVECSVIIETHTHHEGGSRDRLRAVIRAALAMRTGAGHAEVLVADVGVAGLAPLLAAEFPRVKRVAATDMGYDEAKMTAVRASTGRFILFLDGDCIPQPDWHERLLHALDSGHAEGCGGYTRYEGGFLAAVMSVMDFGFLYPVVARGLHCYASNNCGFRRETLEQTPLPIVDVRCSCYYHAQLLARRRTPMRLVPEARVLHEMQPILRERSRQGYDTIAVCWVDPEVPEARRLRLGALSLPLFYGARVLTDSARVIAGRRALRVPLWQAGAALLVFPLLRLIDAAGMLRAFVVGRTRGGWGGWEMARKAHAR